MKPATYLFAIAIVGALLFWSNSSHAQMGMGCGMMKMNHSMDTMSHANHNHNATSVKEGKGTGIITAIDLKAKTVTLRHGDIPGVMAAMTMPYQIDSTDLIKDYKVNDHLEFTLQDRGEGHYFVTEIHKSLE